MTRPKGRRIPRAACTPNGTTVKFLQMEAWFLQIEGRCPWDQGGQTASRPGRTKQARFSSAKT